MDEGNGKHRPNSHLRTDTRQMLDVQFHLSPIRGSAGIKKGGTRTEYLRNISNARVSVNLNLLHR